MQAATQLPNQKTTWGALCASVEDFAEWRERTADRYASEEGELLAYLSDQLKNEGAAPTIRKLNHPVLGLLSYASSSNNRLRELLYAYLALAVAGDSEPAKKLVAGQRLTQGLHPEYVAATQCYGPQERAPAPCT